MVLSNLIIKVYRFYYSPTILRNPSEEVEDLYNSFILKYFGCELEEAIKTIPNGEWLMPLVWFRCCTSMIRENRFPLDKVDMAKDMLENKLIPFVKEHLK